MFTVPSLPTESLYKFLTIGGIIIMITSVLYIVSEQQKIGEGIIKYETIGKIYGQKIKNHNNEMDEIYRRYVRDSIRIKGEMKSVWKAKHENNGSVFTSTNGKKYSPNGYAKVLILESNDAVNLYNNSLIEKKKKYEGTYIDKLKVEEQEKLITENADYLNRLTIAFSFIFIIGIISCVYGLKKWKELQMISDKLSKIQLQKAEKELGDFLDKKKLIL